MKESNTNFTLDDIRKALSDEDPNVRATAIMACCHKDPPIDIIEKGFNDPSPLVRLATATTPFGTKLPDYLAKKILDDNLRMLRLDLANASICWNLFHPR